MTDEGSVSVPRRAPGVVWVTVDDEIIALDRSGQAHIVKSTAVLLWPLIDGATTIDELAADVADVFGIEVDVARADVRALVDTMVELGLVVSADPQGTPS